MVVEVMLFFLIWEVLFKFLMIINDMFLFSLSILGGFVEYLCEKLIVVLFEVWLYVCYYYFFMFSMWKILYEFCVFWRYYSVMVDYWSRIFLFFIKRVI